MLVGILLVPQWFDNIVSIRPDWASERGSSVETSDDRVPCHVQNPCALTFMSQVCARYVVVIETCADFLTFLVGCAENENWFGFGFKTKLSKNLTSLKMVFRQKVTKIM